MAIDALCKQNARMINDPVFVSGQYYLDDPRVASWAPQFWHTALDICVVKAMSCREATWVSEMMRDDSLCILLDYSWCNCCPRAHLGCLLHQMCCQLRCLGRHQTSC